MASLVGWRNLFYVLAVWGLGTLLLVYFCIPESNAIKIKADAKKAEKKRQEAAGMVVQEEIEDDEPVVTFNEKLWRMWSDPSFFGLSVVAAL